MIFLRWSCTFLIFDKIFLFLSRRGLLYRRTRCLFFKIKRNLLLSFMTWKEKYHSGQMGITFELILTDYLFFFFWLVRGKRIKSWCKTLSRFLLLYRRKKKISKKNESIFSKFYVSAKCQQRFNNSIVKTEKWASFDSFDFKGIIIRWRVILYMRFMYTCPIQYDLWLILKILRVKNEILRDANKKRA